MTEDIETIIQDWIEEWKQLVTDNKLSEEIESWQEDISKNQNANQQGYPQGEETPRISPYENKVESSGNPTDLELGEEGVLMYL